MANSDLVQSVAKALDVLKYIALIPNGCSLRDLAVHFNMKPPALHNILRTMVNRGYLRKIPGNKYAPGDTLQMIAEHLPDRMVENDELLRKLHMMYPDAVITLAEMSQNAVVCIRRISPDAPGVLLTPVNRTFPPYSGVTGLVTISHSGMSAEELENRWPFEEFGDNWESREKLLEAIVKCRKNGFAMKQRNISLMLATALPDGRTLGFHHPNCDLERGNVLLREILEIISGLKA